MKPFLFSILIICTLSLSAQTSENVWFEAAIKLMDGGSQKGEANYSIRDHIVQVIVDDKVYTYSESQVQEMLLSQGANHHHFMLVALKNEFDRVELNLVEMIYRSQEHYSLVKRHQADKKTFKGTGVPITSPTAVGTVTGNGVGTVVGRGVGTELERRLNIGTVEEVRANVNKDSFITKQNALSRRGFERLVINYEGFSVVMNRKNLLETLKDEKKGIKKFMKKRKLNLKNDEDVIQVLMEYERLKQ